MEDSEFHEDVKKHPYKFIKASYEAIHSILQLDEWVIKEPRNKPITEASFKILADRKSGLLNFKAEVQKVFLLNNFDFKFLGFDLPLT